MAVVGKQITLTSDTAVRLSGRDPGTDGQSVAITSCDVDVYLGGDSTVTSSTGAKLASGTPISVDLGVNEELWVNPGADGTAHVLAQGVAS